MPLDSTYLDILTAVQQQVLTLESVTLLPSQVRVRKRPSFQKDHDTLPFVCISPEAERIDAEQFGNNIHLAYPVNVVLLTEDRLLLEDLAWQLAMRQAIRQRLHKAGLAGASTVFDCRSVDLEPVYDLQGLDSAFDVSVLRFTFVSAEQREES